MSALDIEQQNVSCWTPAAENHHPHLLTVNVNSPTFAAQQQKQPQSKCQCQNDVFVSQKLKSAEEETAALKQQIADAVAERDAHWRKHEKAQLEFVQKENEKLMGKMHVELERLHMANRELGRRLHVEKPKTAADSNGKVEQLKRDLSAERKSNADLCRELGLAVKRSARLAQMMERNGHMQKEQMAQKDEKLAELREQIRRLNALLLAKPKNIGSTTVAGIGVHRRSQSGEASRSHQDRCN